MAYTDLYSHSLFSDIKECDLTPCSQICLEEDGGYSCQCESGFKLSQDSKTCSGKSFIFIVYFPKHNCKINSFTKAFIQIQALNLY